MERRRLVASALQHEASQARQADEPAGDDDREARFR
jgi:hypothetical protein